MQRLKVTQLIRIQNKYGNLKNIQCKRIVVKLECANKSHKR